MNNCDRRTNINTSPVYPSPPPEIDSSISRTPTTPLVTTCSPRLLSSLPLQLRWLSRPHLPSSTNPLVSPSFHSFFPLTMSHRCMVRSRRCGYRRQTFYPGPQLHRDKEASNHYGLHPRTGGPAETGHSYCPGLCQRNCFIH